MSIYKGVVQRAQLQLARFQVKKMLFIFYVIFEKRFKCRIEERGGPILASVISVAPIFRTILTH